LAQICPHLVRRQECIDYLARQDEVLLDFGRIRLICSYLGSSIPQAEPEAHRGEETKCPEQAIFVWGESELGGFAGGAAGSVAVQAGRVAVVCDGLLVRREAYVGLGCERHALQVIQCAELVGMESCLVEASPVEGNSLVGVAEKRAQTGGLIASQQTRGPKSFYDQAGYTGCSRSQIGIGKCSRTRFPGRAGPRWSS